jgi:hypothetical protein
MNVLQWAIENGCKCDDKTYQFALNGLKTGKKPNKKIKKY